MNTSALILMLTIQISVTVSAIYFLVKLVKNDKNNSES